MSRHSLSPFFHRALIVLLTSLNIGLIAGLNAAKAHAGAGGIGPATCNPNALDCDVCLSYVATYDPLALMGDPDTFLRLPGAKMKTARAMFAVTPLQFDSNKTANVGKTKKYLPSGIFNSSTQQLECINSLRDFHFGLITGGVGVDGAVTNTAELFGPLRQEDAPASGPDIPTYKLGFSSTEPMGTARAMHQATLLSFKFWSSDVAPDVALHVRGDALITGGSSSLTGGPQSTFALSSAEIFTFTGSFPADPNNPSQPGKKPAKGKFKPAGNMQVARTLHQATLLNDGTVLITGGLDEHGQVLESAEIYSPKTGFTFTKHHMTRARFGHTATLLQDGNVLIAGGDSNGGTYPNLDGASALKEAEIYHFQDQKFETVGPMKVARAGHSATLIPDSRSGTVLIAGGIGHHGVTDSAELFIPGSGFVKVQHMKSPRFLHAAAFIPTGRQVLIAGGAHDSQLDTVATAERYDPTHGIFSYTIMPMHIARRSFSAAAKIPIQFSDMVILPGGENASGIPQRDTDIYLPLK